MPKNCSGFGSIKKNIDISIPHHTTIRQWIIRYGCHNLCAPLNQANDWLTIGDLTISVGKLKCLATIGIRMSDLEQKENLILTHKDVEILGLYPTEKSTGEFVEKAFEDSAKRIGGSFFATILDRGSDIKKGAKLFQQNHPGVKLVHDIPHKLSNVMEHELKNDPQWSEYIQKQNITRKRAFQTELAALMPKKQREKARFMNIGCFVYWPDRIRKSKEKGYLCKISEEKYQDYLGWIDEFTLHLDEWKFMDGIVQMTNELVRTYGLSLDVYSYIKIFLEEAPIEGERLKNFSIMILKAVWEEVEKLDKDQTLIGSTEVIESIFGKYKSINEGLHGITANILGMCTFVGRERSGKEIKEALEKCSVKNALEFIKGKFGQTLNSLRKEFFPSSKRTNNDRFNEGVFTA